MGFSERVTAMFARVGTRTAPVSRQTVLDALAAAGVPPYDRFLDALTSFGGYKYRVLANFYMINPQSDRGGGGVVGVAHVARHIHSRGGRHLLNVMDVSGDTETYYIDPDGTLYRGLARAVPLATRFETYIEGDAVLSDYEQTHRGWKLLIDELTPGSGERLGERLGIPPLAEATDRYRSVYCGDASAVLVAPLAGSSKGSETLWALSDSSDDLERITQASRDLRANERKPVILDEKYVKDRIAKISNH